MHPRGHPWSDDALQQLMYAAVVFRFRSAPGRVQWPPFGIVGLQRCLDVLVIPQCLDNAWASLPALAMPKPHIRRALIAASHGDAFAALKTAKGRRADCETLTARELGATLHERYNDYEDSRPLL
jgi:hypothetical protein